MLAGSEFDFIVRWDQKSKHCEINCGICLSRIPTGEHAGCSKVMVWRLCGVTRPLSPCLNLYVTQESTWDTNHAWKVFSFFLHFPLSLSCLPPTSLLCFPSLFQLQLTVTWLCFFFCLFSKKTSEFFSPTVPLVFSFILLSISRAWHFRGNQGKGWVEGQRNEEKEEAGGLSHEVGWVGREKARKAPGFCNILQLL